MNDTAKTSTITLREVEFTAMTKKCQMFFYEKSDAIIRSQLISIFPTAIIHSITDYEALLTKKESRIFDEEFKIKTINAKQHLTNPGTE